MRIWLFILLPGLVVPHGVSARSLLCSSEQTHASVCLGRDAGSDKLIAICQQALVEGGFSRTQHVQILTNLGDAYRFLDRLDEAEARYREALELNPRAVVARNGLGWVAFDRDDNSAAAALFAESLAILPTGDALAGYGGTAFWAKEIGAEAALDYVELALSLQPKDRWNLRTKGWILFDSRRYQEAVEPFRKATELNDEDANAHKGLARALNELDRMDEAQQAINRAVELAPEDNDALLWRSHISRWNGNNLRALKDAELLMQRNPERPDGVVLKARALSAMGFDHLAISTLDEAVPRYRDDNFLTYWRAKFLFEDDQFAAAAALIRENIQRDGGDGHDQQLLAEAALELGQLEEARSAIKAARREMPWVAKLGYLESRLLVLEKRFDEAEEVFDAAIEAGLWQGYIAKLAQVLIQQGEPARAIALRAKY